MMTATNDGGYESVFPGCLLSHDAHHRFVRCACLICGDS